MKKLIYLFLFAWSVIPLWAAKKYNVLFIISDDLTSTALSCYGNTVSRTPNIDALAAKGTRFTRTYCQGTYCGPSRASFMSGYYPHATGVLGYKSPRPEIGDRATWSQHFMNHGYHAARVSKIYHMGVPGGIEQGGHGADDAASWNERYNSPGPEWRAPGKGETLQGNPDGKRPVVGGNTFVVVEAEGDDLVHSDGKTAVKAAELIGKFSKQDKPFFLGVGFVRPHVPFVAPKKYYEPFLPYSKMKLPPKIEGDWDDIPKPGINYCTSLNMKMDIRKQKKAVGGYYASVAFVDAQVGKVMAALKASGQEDNTIVIFTSDPGYHLGEHDMWQKVSIHEESAKVPLIICAPGKKPAVCHSLTELIDLYPTISNLCDLKIPRNIQGKDISGMLNDPSVKVREGALSSGKGRLWRTERWAYLDYGKTGELYDMEKDPQQYTNLINDPEHAMILNQLKDQLKSKLNAIDQNDLTSSR